MSLGLLTTIPWMVLRHRFQARRLAQQGQRLYRQEQYAEAAAQFQRSLELRPDAALVRFNWGLALYKAGERREARDAWQDVLAQTQENNPYLAEQARIMLRQFG